jgi:hypothetical protein
MRSRNREMLLGGVVDARLHVPHVLRCETYAACCPW